MKIPDSHILEYEKRNAVPNIYGSLLSLVLLLGVQGWLNYSNCAQIRGTPFVAFKTPLREGYSTTLQANKSFTPKRLLEKQPKIKLVIDLTYTTKYYNGKKEFEENGIRYVKIKCNGHKLPMESNVKKFFEIVDEFIATNPKDYLIGVHCTHGVNRTGYIIVRYMIERFNYTAENALREFSRSRGYPIERMVYIRELLRIQNSSKNVFTI